MTLARGLPLCLLAVLALTGCLGRAPDAAPPERIEVVPSCDCDAPETDEASRARTGFPQGVVWSERHIPQTDGTMLHRVQFDLGKASMADVGAAPQAICAYRGESLISSQVRLPGPEDRDLPDTMVLEVLCQP